jgi:hypothetical protein
MFSSFFFLRLCSDGKLEAHPSVRHHLLADLPGIVRDDNTIEPFVLVDTAGSNLDEDEVS